MAAYQWCRRLALSLLSVVIFASLAQAAVYGRSIVVTNPTSEFLGVIPVDVPIQPGMLTGVGPSGDNMWFLSDDGVTLLPHWVETWAGGNGVAKVWVRVPPLMPNSSRTFYLRYGSPAQGASSFAATFPSSYLLTSGNTTLGGFVPYYDSFEIGPGATVTAQAGTHLTINAARIRIDGTVDALGKGAPGQFSPWTSGLGFGAGSASVNRGGAGAGYGGGGGAGGSLDATTAPGGSAYGTASGTDIDMGSSGGSGQEWSGAGGGMVKMKAQRIDVNGTIDVRGEWGRFSFFGWGGGGGSGGSLGLEAGRVYFGPATVRADGGGGGDPGGGGGGGGRIKVHVGTWFLYDENNPPSVTYGGGSAMTSGVPTLPQPGSPGALAIHSYGAIGQPSPWVTVSVGDEQTVVSVDPSGRPQTLVGLPIPNPSHGNVSLRLELARPGHGRVAILDLQGRQVRSLVDGAIAAGAREVSWDLRDENGSLVRGGLYFARVEVDGSRWTRKVLVAR